MEATNRQKLKLLMLMEMLQQDSDQHHPLTTRQLQARLEEQNISCDRRTLSRDMADLNEAGYEIMSVMCGHEKGYYVDDRKFSIPELRILMDAVQAAGFITPVKTARLMEKIAALGGSHQAGLLQSNTVLFNDHKHSNEAVYYTISTLEEAVSARKKVSFRYFKLNENLEKIYQREGTRYQVEPVSLVLDRSNYYLIALSGDREGISIYRIDRIEDMCMEEAPVSAEAEEAKKQLPEVTSQAFKMFLGPTESVVLEFDDSLLGAVFDQFGEDVPVIRVGDSLCRTRVRVQISGTFFGWLFQFGDLMRLTGPDRVVRQVRNFASQLPY